MNSFRVNHLDLCQLICTMHVPMNKNSFRLEYWFLYLAHCQGANLFYAKSLHQMQNACQWPNVATFAQIRGHVCVDKFGFNQWLSHFKC